MQTIPTRLPSTVALLLENLPRPANDLVDYEKEHKVLLERIAQALATGPPDGPAPAGDAASRPAPQTGTRTKKPRGGQRPRKRNDN